MSVQNSSPPAPGQGVGPIGVRAPLDLDSRRREGGRAPRPFAALPHDIAGDPRISPLGKAVLLALLYWARGKPSCWPSDASIAAKVGRSIGTVQRTLRHLVEAGAIVREKTNANRTGRLIVLAWRRADARPLPAPAREALTPPARDEGNVIVKGDTPKETPPEAPERRRPETGPEPAPVHVLNAEEQPAPSAIKPPVERPAAAEPLLRRPAWVHELATVGDDPIVAAELARRSAPAVPAASVPRDVPELLARLREDPARVAQAAEALAQDLDDRKSWNGLHAVCRRAWEGQIDPGALVVAWREATSGRARVPGAVFMTVVRRETKR